MGDYSLMGIFLACALGIPVPEELTLLSAGILVSTKQLQLDLAFMSGVSGILMSDSILYFLGRYLGPQVFRWYLFRTVFTVSRVKWAEYHIRRNGTLFCFIGRFLPGLRVVIFTTTGALGIKPNAFLVIDALAAVISVLLWISIGNWMGSSFLDAALHAQEIKVGLICIAVLIFVIGMTRQIITRS